MVIKTYFYYCLNGLLFIPIRNQKFFGKVWLVLHHLRLATLHRNEQHQYQSAPIFLVQFYSLPLAALQTLPS